MRVWLKLKNIISKWSFWLTLLFFLYFLKLAPTDLVSYGWSTKFVRLGFVGGNHWAIQFGLLLKIVNIFTKILPLSVIRNSYVLASFLGAISLGVFYKLLVIIENLIQIGNKKIRFLLKNVLLVLLGTSHAFFLQSQFVERYMLVVLGLEIIALLIYKISKNNFKFGKNIVFLVITLIFGVSYHWLFLWALFLILIGFLLENPISKKRLISYIVGFIFIILGGVLVGKVLTSKTNPTHTYLRENSLGNSIDYYLSSYFSDGFTSIFSVNSSNFSKTFLSIVSLFDRIDMIFILMLSLLGIRVVIEKFGKKSYLWLLFMAGIILWPSFLFSNFKNIWEVLELYNLIIVVSLGLFSFIGALLISDRFVRGLSIVHNKKSINTIFLIISSGIIVFSLLSKKSEVITSNYEAEEIKKVLKQLPGESMMLCFEDLICSDLMYFSTIENIGEAVTIVPYYYHPDSYNLDLSKYRIFGYKENPYILHEVLSLALSGGNNRVFSMGISNDYFRFLGFNLGFVHYLPLGNFGEVTLVTPDKWPIYDDLENINFELKDKSLLENKFINLLLENRVLNSNILFLSGKYQRGYGEMNAASKVASKLPEEDFLKFLSLRNNAEQYKKNPLFVDSNKKESVDKVINDIPLYIDGGYYSRAADLARGIIMLEPLDKDVRVRASEVYQKIGQQELSKFELEISKKLN